MTEKENLCCESTEVHEELLKIINETMPEETELYDLAELFGFKADKLGDFFCDFITFGGKGLFAAIGKQFEQCGGSRHFTGTFTALFF